MKIFFLFKDADGSFSWRKGLTALTGIIFVTSIIGYLFFDCRELPKSYQMIISGVFGFYFTKDLFVKKNNLKK